MGDLDPDLPGPAASTRPPPSRPRRTGPEPEVAAEALEPGKILVLMSDGRELERVTKDRFVIGRGKHFDLVINSGKVSREHAAIVRENGEYFIEDLGSSNGTWFEKRRIGRRQIHEGDDYFICAEKLSCTFR
jgi:pSer/pThr/pTyr-binding forkhead associated (FHA) protein